MSDSKVFKYIMVAPRQTFDMPQGALVLSTGTGDGYPALWAEIVLGRPIVERAFQCVNTGRVLPKDRIRFIGTVQCGVTVWHIYEVPPKP